MSAPTQTAGPGARTTYTAPVAHPQPTDVTRVLVVGHGDGRRVRWALTQTWRRAGRPIVVGHDPVDTSAVAWRASEWAAEHRCAGVVGQVGPVCPDVLLTFGSTSDLSAELRTALPLARRAGLVVDGDTVEEFA